MNSFNILKELQQLIGRSHLPKITDEIRRSASEAISVLGNDDLLVKYFSLHLEKLKPLLTQILENKKNPPLDITSYYLKDFLTDLQQEYRNIVIAELEKAIFESHDFDRIFRYTGSLLTQLIDEGHSIEELFNIAQNIFIRNRSQQVRSFVENFQFTKEIITRARSEYKILFRLEGCKKYHYWPEQIGDIEIIREPSIQGAPQDVDSFLYPGQNVLFAQMRVLSQDDRSAGLSAKKELDEILDLIRFELEQEVVSVSQAFVSVRVDSGTSRKFLLPSYIQNPMKNVKQAEFEDFLKTTANMFETNHIDSESRERIKSGLRFYRMGRDSELFENKFLNWWTALEFLSRTGEKGAIPEEVESKLVAALVPHYTVKHLQSYKDTLNFCNVSNVRKEISLLDLLQLIRDQNEYANIRSELSEFPIVDYRLNYFRQQTKDAESLYRFLTRHKQNLKWHIHRIYRIRCDIVHSAKYTITLTLLCANLEYYLKSLLSLILANLEKK
jgi:hypothetical protein